MENNTPIEAREIASEGMEVETVPVRTENAELLPWTAPELREFGAVALLTAGIGLAGADGPNNNS